MRNVTLFAALLTVLPASHSAALVGKSKIREAVADQVGARTLPGAVKVEGRANKSVGKATSKITAYSAPENLLAREAADTSVAGVRNITARAVGKFLAATEEAGRVCAVVSDDICEEWMRMKQRDKERDLEAARITEARSCAGDSYSCVSAHYRAHKQYAYEYKPGYIQPIDLSSITMPKKLTIWDTKPLAQTPDQIDAWDRYFESPAGQAEAARQRAADDSRRQLRESQTGEYIRDLNARITLQIAEDRQREKIDAMQKAQRQWIESVLASYSSASSPGSASSRSSSSSSSRSGSSRGCKSTYTGKSSNRASCTD